MTLLSDRVNFLVSRVRSFARAPNSLSTSARLPIDSSHFHRFYLTPGHPECPGPESLGHRLPRGVKAGAHCRVGNVPLVHAPGDHRAAVQGLGGNRLGAAGGSAWRATHPARGEI